MTSSCQRRHLRLKTKSGIASAPQGFCQVANISEGGFSLKCFKEHSFPETWYMDLYDKTGLSIEELKVKKIWEKRTRKSNADFQAQVEVGCAFEHLSSSQKSQLHVYLRQLAR